LSITIPRAFPTHAHCWRASGTPQYDTGEQLLPWADRWTDADTPADPLEATGPFPIVIPPEQPPREQSRFVIVAVAATVVLVLLASVLSVRDLFSNDGESAGRGGATASPTPSASGGPSSPAPTPQATTPAAGATGPRIAAIRAIDPEGDKDEDTRRSPRAVDGDPETTWRSQVYRSASFGGLKDGVGLALRLERPAALHGVQLDAAGKGGTVEVRVGPSADVTASKVVATADLTGEGTTIDVSGATPAQYVILWFTSLPKDGGKFRIEVSEVRLT
jgi:hypothetical protein